MGARENSRMKRKRKAIERDKILMEKMGSRIQRELVNEWQTKEVERNEVRRLERERKKDEVRGETNTKM